MPHRFFGLLLLTICASSVAASGDDTPLSPRNANYTIEVKLNAEDKTLEGREIVHWRNQMEVATEELCFHLYWNAWRNNRSTWLQEEVARRERSVEPDGWAYCEVELVKILPSDDAAEQDLTEAWRYEAPDDGNPDDRTVMVLPLPEPVAPGDSVRLEIRWKSKIPRTFSRTGFRGNFFFIGQWFPKLGVYQEDGSWNCHQFHTATEFFSDYGVYDVRMNVPTGWLLGATGRQQKVVDNPDGTTTHHYRQGDVHDFVWTTSPEYREISRRFEHAGLSPVDMRLLYQPEHEAQVDRHFRATETALRLYGTWYGEYPYGHITVVDPAYQSGVGEMEYPTLFTVGTRILNPEGRSPEIVAVHEAGHQFWHGMVGNNEFEHAWLDEGLNTFSHARAIDTEYGDLIYFRRFFKEYLPVRVPEIRLRRMTSGNRVRGYRQYRRADVQATPTYRYYPGLSAYAMSYDKTAIWLSMIEKAYGWEALQQGLSAFFNTWKFRHPKPEDLIQTLSESVGRDLNPFFDEVHRKAVVFDYAIAKASSKPLNTKGYLEGSLSVSAKDHEVFETQVVVRRLQDGILPVEVVFEFEDGDMVREVWDGQSLWKLYQFQKPAKLVSAVVDPERKILLDVNSTNNSWQMRSGARFPSGKWASKWMVWLQDYFQTLAFLF